MLIIKIEPDDSGLHTIESQSHRQEVWMDGYVEVPEGLVQDAIGSGGYCDLEIENGCLVGVVALERPPEPGPDPGATIAGRLEALEQQGSELQGAVSELQALVEEIFEAQKK